MLCSDAKPWQCVPHLPRMQPQSQKASTVAQAVFCGLAKQAIEEKASIGKKLLPEQWDSGTRQVSLQQCLVGKHHHCSKTGECSTRNSQYGMHTLNPTVRDYSCPNQHRTNKWQWQATRYLASPDCVVFALAALSRKLRKRHNPNSSLWLPRCSTTRPPSGNRHPVAAHINRLWFILLQQ